MQNKVKMWLIVVDVVFSVITLVVTTLLTPDNVIRLLVVGVVAIIQPAILAIIKLYDVESAMKEISRMLRLSVTK